MGKFITKREMGILRWETPKEQAIINKRNPPLARTYIVMCGCGSLACHFISGYTHEDKATRDYLANK